MSWNTSANAYAAIRSLTTEPRVGRIELEVRCRPWEDFREAEMAELPMIDREKVRAVVRRHRDGDDLRRLLDRAIDRLPERELLGFIEGYAWPHDLESDGSPPVSLDEAVEEFRADSLSGRYYETLDVKSRYHWMKSYGTQLWIAECHRLLEWCGQAVDEGELDLARSPYEVLFHLLAQIDRGSPNILFFCDEHGSDKVGVHWFSVLPRWFRCIAAADPPEVFASEIHQVTAYFAHYEWDRLIPLAMAVASDEQRRALSALAKPSKAYRFELPPRV